MSYCNKCSYTGCGCLGIVIGIVAAVVVGVLYAFLQIPFLITVVWVAFGLGALMLLMFVTAAVLSGIYGPNVLSRCICKNLPCMLTAIIGTIVMTIILLGAPLNPLFISNIILVSIGAFFLALLIVEVVYFLDCICCLLFYHREE